MRLFSFLTGIALSLALASAVQAQVEENSAVINQVGQDNTARIDQTGLRNEAGSDVLPMLQQGTFNAIEIDQIGADNLIGLENDGVFQSGDTGSALVFNQIDIDQLSGPDSGGVTLGNVIGSIRQTTDGAVDGVANLLIIQQGAKGVGGNRVGAVVQQQFDGMPGQRAEIYQDGEGNVLDLLVQRSGSFDTAGGNTIIARFTGSFNGIGDLTGPAQIARVQDNSLIQDIGYDGTGASGNFIDLLVTGNDNIFGVYQGGVDNTVGLVSISGQSNEVGLGQDGFENEVIMTEIEGDDNRIGLDQLGTNRAWLSMIGDSSSNNISGRQEGSSDLEIYIEGDRNRINATQGYLTGIGDSNQAEIRIIGDSNFFDLTQRGENTATIAVTGSQNNLAGTFTGDAALDAGLAPGYIDQMGMGNASDITILGSLNLFASRQEGDDHLLEAMITGQGNQAAVIQQGPMNVTRMSQSGKGNNAGVRQ